MTSTCVKNAMNQLAIGARNVSYHAYIEHLLVEHRDGRVVAPGLCVQFLVATNNCMACAGFVQDRTIRRGESVCFDSEQMFLIGFAITTWELRTLGRR
jgi:hypothetical protein